MEKSECSICKEKKSLESFSFRNKAKGIRHECCKHCSRVRINQHYQNNKNYYKTKARKRDKSEQEKIKLEIWKYLSEHPCVDCGEKDPVVLEFDHVRGKKFKAISFMIMRKYNIFSIQEEIKKCDIRCCNCHKRKTAKDFNHWRILRA
jgi:hypothetical protein